MSHICISEISENIVNFFNIYKDGLFSIKNDPKYKLILFPTNQFVRLFNGLFSLSDSVQDVENTHNPFFRADAIVKCEQTSNLMNGMQVILVELPLIAYYFSDWSRTGTGGYNESSGVVR